MGTAALIIALIANAVGATWFFVRVLPRFGWVAPLPIVWINYVLHYPLRAALVAFSGYNRTYELQGEELATALLYGLCFMLLLTVTFERYEPGRTGPLLRSPPTGVAAPTVLFLHSLFWLYLASFSYVAATGALFSLGNPTYATSQTIARFGLSVRWLFLGCAVAIGTKRWSRVLAIETGVVVLSVVGGALVSTGKGDIVNLLILWVVAVGIGGKSLPKAWVALGVAAALLFSIYSFLVRYSGTVTGKSDTAVVFQNLEQVFLAAGDMEIVKEAGVNSSIDRFSGVDGLALCVRKNTFLEDGFYMLGSMAEWVLVVPKAMWPQRPVANFNYYVTQYVWGYGREIESGTPLGRIGESFFVLNWAGLVYAVAYGVLWKWLFTRLFRSRESIVARGYYIALMFFTAFTDDNLMPPVLSVVFISCLAVVGAIVTEKAAKGQRTEIGLTSGRNQGRLTGRRGA